MTKSYCANCGYNVPKTAHFCTGCGRAVAISSDPQSTITKANLTVLIGSGCIAVVIGLFLFGTVIAPSFGGVTVLSGHALVAADAEAMSAAVQFARGDTDGAHVNRLESVGRLYILSPGTRVVEIGQSLPMKVMHPWTQFVRIRILSGAYSGRTGICNNSDLYQRESRKSED